MLQGTLSVNGTHAPLRVISIKTSSKTLCTHGRPGPPRLEVMDVKKMVVACTCRDAGQLGQDHICGVRRRHHIVFEDGCCRCVCCLRSATEHARCRLDLNRVHG